MSRRVAVVWFAPSVEECVGLGLKRGVNLDLLLLVAALDLCPAVVDAKRVDGVRDV